MMNYKDQFDQLVNFLSPIKNIWAKEVVDYFPHDLDVFNADWIKFLEGLDDKQLWQIDCHSNYSEIENSELGQWIKKIEKLCIVEDQHIGPLDELPNWAFKKVKEKKQHEILLLANMLKEIQKENKFESLVDIGGGVGHLARTLAHYYEIESISLDIDKDFQEIGKKRLTKYPKPETAKDVTFINHDFSTNLASDLNKKIFTKVSFSLGLHTCGPLANHHINAAIKNDTKGFINFGCCYNRLDIKNDTNLSQHAKDNGMELSEYSLTLATRGHSSMDYEGFKLKRRVKFFRYALQLYLLNYEGIDRLQPVGEAHARVYWGEFSTYALDKLAKIGHTSKLSADELNAFFENEENQKLLQKMFYANVIRWQLGRPLELYILLDRILYLQEQGHEARLKKVFNKELSPRNLAIICVK